MIKEQFVTRLGLFFVLLLLGPAIVVAGRWSIADVAANMTKRNLETWENSGVVSSIERWDAAISQIRLAQRLNKNDSQNFRLEGQLYEWRGYVEDDTQGITNLFRNFDQSLTAYRRSTTLNPAWPDGWVLLAKQKAALRQFDEEFTSAIEKAVTLGGWEPRIQYTITGIATLSWSVLDLASRQLILETIEKSLSLLSTDSTEIRLLSFGSLISVVCPLLNQEILTARAKAACGNAEP